MLILVQVCFTIGIAKAGINNMTRTLGAECTYGIRMGVAPGPIYIKGAFDRLDPKLSFPIN